MADPGSGEPVPRRTTFLYFGWVSRNPSMFLSVQATDAERQILGTWSLRLEVWKSGCKKHEKTGCQGAVNPGLILLYNDRRDVP